MLLKSQILEGYRNGKIHIEPFTESQIGPNSYDVRLGDILCVYNVINDVINDVINYLDCKKNNPTKTIKIPDDGYVLQPGVLYLGNTVECIGSDYYVPMYDGRSSMGRLGILSHISAGVGDIGFKRQWTLEISVIHPVKVYKGMRIGQVHFHVVNEEYNRVENRYSGKYCDQNGPQPSKSYMDDLYG